MVKKKEDSINIKADIICHSQNKFKKIMALDGVTTKDIMNSLKIEDNIQNVFKAGQGAG